MTAPPRPPARPRTPTLRERVAELERTLAAITELHSPTVARMCRECLTRHPCTTVELAAPPARTDDTPGRTVT